MLIEFGSSPGPCNLCWFIS